MNNFEHKKLIEAIVKLDVVPETSGGFSDWIHGEAHLTFLKNNTKGDEVAIYASGESSFIHSMVLPNSKLFPIDKNDLMKWSIDPYASSANYVTGGGRDDVWIERDHRGLGSKVLENAIPLTFGRTFEGWTGAGSNYFEVHQEYAHLTNIHWRPERRAYCRFDENGDLESTVSVTTRDDNRGDVALVSFRWEPLEEYLATANASLIRMFDFMMLRRGDFCGWSDDSPEEFCESDQFFYEKKEMPSHAAYIRGVQIIQPRRPPTEIFAGIVDGWSGQKNKRYAEFTAYDWRNSCVVKISTDPSATTNYFEAEDNFLPFELSPAFFRPEVLLKYKADRDKYTVGERDVSCRAAWRLKGIDVNEAGQVHAYICDLRWLPYAEQLHWLSYNEPPKTNISDRAVINDFKGEYVTVREPLQKVLSVIRRWHSDGVEWWALRDEKLLDRVSVPLTSSREEWAEAFMDLAKLVVEGFKVKPIRSRLDGVSVLYDKTDKSIMLLEKLFNNGVTSGNSHKLNGLRSVQYLRSKVKGHVSGRDAEQLSQDAIMEYETYGNHFQEICRQVADELVDIEQLFL